MASPVIQSVGSAGTLDPAGTSLNVPKPSGVAETDLMVAGIHVVGGSTTGLPSGWTLDRSVTDNGSGTLYVYWKIASDIEASSYTWSVSSSHIATGRIVRITGYYTPGPIEESVSASPAASTTQTSPSVTTRSADTLLLRFLGLDRTDNAITSPGSPHTERWNFGSASAAGSAQAMASAPQAALGASGTADFTLASSRASSLITSVVASGAPQTTAVGTALGVATVSGVGFSLDGSQGSASGSGSASGAGASTAGSPGSSSGTSNVLGVGTSTAQSLGSSSGVGSALGVGSGTDNASGSAAGSATALGVGSSLAASIGSSSGLAVVSSVGAAQGNAVGSSAGLSVNQAFGNSLATSAGSSAGVSSVLGIGASTSGSVGSSSGTSTVEGFGPDAAPAQGLASGAATVSGVGAALGSAIGSSSGSSSAFGFILTFDTATGSSAGTSTVLGVGTEAMASAGTSTGLATVSGVGSSVAQAVASAAGLSTGLAVAAINGAATGTANGSATVLGVGNANFAAIGIAAGTSTAHALVGVVVPSHGSSGNPSNSTISTCELVDYFIGSASSDLSAHTADTGQSWVMDATTPASPMLLDGTGFFYVVGPTRSLYRSSAVWSEEYVSSLTVTRWSALGRLGPVVGLLNGSGVWGYYDGENDLWGIASLTPTGPSVLVTRSHAGVALGGSTSLVLWAVGRHAMLAADGQIILATLIPTAWQPYSVGIAGDGPSSPTTGLAGSVCLTCRPRVAGQGGYLGGDQDDVGRSITQTVSAWGYTGSRSSFASLEPEPFPHAGMPMSILRSGISNVDPSLLPGLGRTYDAETYAFGLTLVGKYHRDHPAQDTLGLFHETSGLTFKGRSIWDILHMSFPRSPTGDYLTPEPLSMSGATSQPRVYRQNRGWRAMDIAGRVALAAPMSPLD